MPSLKAIRKRVTSVRNTQKITKAMKMVSAAKLRRAQDAAVAARPYAQKLTALLANVAARVGTSANPLLQGREEIRTIHAVLITADRGLCGGYNSNLIRKTEAFLREHGRDKVRLTFVGRRGFDYFKRRPVNIADKHINLFGGPQLSLAQQLAQQFIREYVEGETDAVYLIYNQFRSALVQTPVAEQLLPVPAGVDAAANADSTDYLYEPDAGQLLDNLTRRYVTVLVHRAFLEAVASEHGARMTAMDSATSNASEMIDRLTLQMNRARQAGITKELMEIVGGAEALNA
ncbi:MAG TPA: ATP synthase F1 subunit gamma [Terriglobales bacterium]|nr:ATP synthase F1 subunit gamma [Terriglobales bacterium]